MKLPVYWLSISLFLAVDAVWLSIMTPLVYQPALESIISESPRLLPAMSFYIAYAIGIVILIVKPSLQMKSSVRQALKKGVVFGMLAYGTYELTNFATISAWPVHIVILDILWGGLITGFVAAVVYKYAKHKTIGL
jgi:uncharacterized membrane protein